MNHPAGPAGPVLLGVGGGIAAYKAGELIRRLRAAGLDVVVVPTDSALRFVGAATFEALSGNPVATDVFTDVPSVRHVATGQQASLVVVAPATADVLARAAVGRADDLLTASLLVTRAPVLMAPAMHTEMWTHPATVANVATLRSRGVHVVDPAVGRLTGADSGAGRLPEPEHLADLAVLLHRRPDALPHDLAGRRVLVTAGGTREPLDPVRYLGNRSSGRQGWALALVAAARGAAVTLVAANVEEVAPPGVTVVPVGDARELSAAVDSVLDDPAGPVDAVVMAAAVADFRPAAAAEVKIKKLPGGAPPVVELVENPDILAGIAHRTERRPAVVVGFAAETGAATGSRTGATAADPLPDATDASDPVMASVLEYARQKLARKGCDLLVVNRVDQGRAFGAPDNAAVLLAPARADHRADHGADAAQVVAEVPLGPKTVLAAAVWDAVSERLAGRPAAPPR
ncbi:bifunctional phosphopantothenoylcysteine decarboxylase/phosphopantothenate--cysteine ligase CoaBC [Nakamurella leprariae]|uniref:Coenzyme A biosynthesis bifunctional protein CoaBC n=1 Tax=Nakamurella leprariae TaxID=2803911 RepID=A0A939BZ37_9ACTN|nr:bifunctional phosphopantothenoylcysteine decarboxylase/phosphopantothenate--cysteine ligase CoaBC [Nakamurella leprariae]MBM9467740.1 bifunctional phosphopantothenoylcysteine decarboxylase/phosphopantothenate--cysteine ligase CoaBC [Nakamurella leprariae]